MFFKVVYRTLVSIIIITALFFAAAFTGNMFFDRKVGKEISGLFPETPAPTKTVHSSSFDSLPLPVRRWLEFSNIEGKEFADFISLSQTGEMRLSPEGEWLNARAKQYFRADTPAFIWNADVREGLFMSFSARDKYEEGRGNMWIKLFSIFTVADAEGPEIDQGVLLRFLAETIWFPSAALRDYIKWEAIDSLSARAVITHNGMSAPGVFKFTPEGKVSGFSAIRYYSRKERSTLEKWEVSVDTESYKSFGGRLIPTKASVTWKLEEGDFNWFRLLVNGVKYNDGAYHSSRN
ncbi:MAG: DUF6544 family protein [Fibrobacterota bacterium]